MYTRNPSNRAIPIITLLSISLFLLYSFRQSIPSHPLDELISHQPWSHSNPSSTRKEILSLLTHTPTSQVDFAWTDNDGTGLPLITFGESPAEFIKFDDSTIIDVKTGEVILGVNEGHSFNLAIAKLPQGSKWGFVGVARGPTRRRKFMQINGNDSREQVLVAFGLNITSSGSLFPVTPGQTLDIPMIPKEGCHVSGVFIATYGPEDPRLFWTDRGTIGLTYTRNTADPNACRGIGYIEDLRSVYVPLDEAMAIGEGARVFENRKEAGEGVDKELVREKDQGKIEKNWVAFFPGAVPNPSTRFPSIHYSFSPALTLTPSTSDARKIVYTDLPSPPSKIATCLSDAHPSWVSHKLHQSTPFYRLTLCERGCYADESNTVMITLGHAERRPRYAKFISVWNVTAPHDPISVGPIFNINGLNDVHHINYGMALTPLQPSDLHPSLSHKKTPRSYTPGHFFIDDDVLITLGHADREMMSKVVPLRELIARQKSCTSIDEEGGREEQMVLDY